MVALLKLNVNLHLSFRYQAGLLGTYFPRHVMAGVLPGEKKIYDVYGPMSVLLCRKGMYVCIFFNDGTLGTLSGTFHVVFLRHCAIPLSYQG